MISKSELLYILTAGWQNVCTTKTQIWKSLLLFYVLCGGFILTQDSVVQLSR